MALQQKSRFGAAFLIIGSLLAAVGEIINTQNMNVLSSSWRFSLGMIIFGTFILLIGLFPLMSTSQEVKGIGTFGFLLLIPGGLLLIIGTATLDLVILPFLTSLANTLGSIINGPATLTQDTLNKIISTLNGLGGSLLSKILPHSTQHIPSAHIPKVNGVILVNQALQSLHLPTIDRLTWWGHFSLSGATLTIGTFFVGMALLRRSGRLTLTGILLVVFSLLNLLCQFVTTIPPHFGNITAALLFLTLVWLGFLA